MVSSYSEVLFELERFLHLLPSSKQDMHTSARERIYTPGAACSVAVVRGSDAALCGCARVGAPPSPERSSKSLLVEGESVKPSVFRRFFIGSSITCGDARSASMFGRMSLGTDFLPGAPSLPPSVSEDPRVRLHFRQGGRLSRLTRFAAFSQKPVMSVGISKGRRAAPNRRE